jgi:hypothetical protein
MTELKHLSPPDLLNFLSRIRHTLEISKAEIRPDHDIIFIDVTFNNHLITITVPDDWYELIASAVFFDDSARAYEQLRFLVADRMLDWLECIYTDWVKNDTGHNIDRNFLQLIVDEIERLQIEFNTEE